jgi:hypothetical protein
MCVVLDGFFNKTQVDAYMYNNTIPGYTGSFVDIVPDVSGVFSFLLPFRSADWKTFVLPRNVVRLILEART